jgi:hypothetical protein
MLITANQPFGARSKVFPDETMTLRPSIALSIIQPSSR